jgi:hypothetical protein
MSAIDLHQDFKALLTYFSNKLAFQDSKLEKDKQDMVNFSIMLLLSRLVPFSFWSVQESKKATINAEFLSTVATITGLIKTQAGNSTYFVRKIAAQSLLPLLEFNQWLPEVFACLDQVKVNKLRQNEAHGLLLRFNIFLSAYFQYRAIAVVETEHAKFKSDEVLIVKSLQEFLQVLPSLTRYSKVTWALFVNTFRQIIEWVPLESKELDILKQTFASLLADIDCQKTLSLE